LRVTENGIAYEYIPLRMLDPGYLREIVDEQRAGFPSYQKVWCRTWVHQSAHLQMAKAVANSNTRTPQQWQVGPVSEGYSSTESGVQGNRQLTMIPRSAGAQLGTTRRFVQTPRIYWSVPPQTGLRAVPAAPATTAMPRSAAHDSEFTFKPIHRRTRIIRHTDNDCASSSTYLINNCGDDVEHRPTKSTTQIDSGAKYGRFGSYPTERQFGRH